MRRCLHFSAQARGLQSSLHSPIRFPSFQSRLHLLLIAKSLFPGFILNPHKCAVSSAIISRRCLLFFPPEKLLQALQSPHTDGVLCTRPFICIYEYKYTCVRVTFTRSLQHTMCCLFHNSTSLNCLTSQPQTDSKLQGFTHPLR